jgi:hypothetical protein
MKASIANPRRSSKNLFNYEGGYSETLTKKAPQKFAALQVVHPKQFSMVAQATNSRSV